MASSELLKWLPYKFYYHHDQLLIKWLYTGDKKFIEPFFDETILKCLSHPYNSKKFKPVSHNCMLEHWSKDLKHIKPTAFIFHVSRCGSTLLSQLLSLSPKNIVLSEVPFFDNLLRLPLQKTDLTENMSDTLFKATLCFYGQQRNEMERFLFIKTDSWHILFHERIRRLFPDVPFILLYRTPEDIVLSHHRKAGMHAVPGVIEPFLFGFNFEEIKDLSLNNYLIKVLEKYYSTYIKLLHYDKKCVIVNYNEGLLNILKKIENSVGMHFSKSEWLEAGERSAFDAKNPELKFSDPVFESFKDDNLQQCIKLYQHLEELRTSVS